MCTRIRVAKLENGHILSDVDYRLNDMVVTQWGPFKVVKVWIETVQENIPDMPEGC